MILFAKAPVPGRVKTRLHGYFTPGQAAELHAALVRDMVSTLLTMAGEADLELHTDSLTDAWSDIEVARRLQIRGGLGERILSALETALAQGHPRAMIVGSDAPSLPAGHLRRLLESPADVALGPARDGGYYAISCRRTHPAMFAGVRWSSPDTLTDTLGAARAAGLTVAVGDPWFDIDSAADLLRLARSGSVPAHTRAWLALHANHLLAGGEPPLQ
jgi:hypothetical protein